MNMAQEYSEIWANYHHQIGWDGPISQAFKIYSGTESFANAYVDYVMQLISTDHQRKCWNTDQRPNFAEFDPIFAGIIPNFCRLNGWTAMPQGISVHHSAPGIGCGCRLESFSRNLRRHGSGVRIRRGRWECGPSLDCDCMGLMSTYGESMWIYG